LDLLLGFDQFTTAPHRTQENGLLTITDLLKNIKGFKSTGEEIHRLRSGKVSRKKASVSGIWGYTTFLACTLFLDAFLFTHPEAL